jgi:hypothetical protein
LRRAVVNRIRDRITYEELMADPAYMEEVHVHVFPPPQGVGPIPIHGEEVGWPAVTNEHDFNPTTGAPSR